MNFDKMMEELRRDYVNSLPQKIKDIEDHFAAKANDVLRDDFHKLKGTGKTYGIPEISVLGEAVEKICMKKPENIASAIPVAVEMLRKIHLARANGNQPFNISSDAAFAPILEIAKNLSS